MPDSPISPSTLSTLSTPSGLRVYLDGCFDLFHVGHANALRQARLQGAYLVAGSHSDEEIDRAKGKTVFSASERYALVAACKWVDEFIPDAPYSPNVPFLCAHNITYALHGSDITLDEEGNDAYAEVKARGMYKEIERTQGVSTTDIINRMMGSNAGADSPYTEASPFIASASRLAAFASPVLPSPPVVYCEGVWDVFNCGHLEFLKAAAQFGPVVCGVLSDEEARTLQGEARPIMGLHERAMGCLQCRYVSDVILAPPSPNAAFLKRLGVSHVLVGTCACRNCNVPAFEEDVRYADAKALGIFSVINISGPFADYTTNTVVERVLSNKALFEKRNTEKGLKELRRIKANNVREGGEL